MKTNARMYIGSELHDRSLKRIRDPILAHIAREVASGRFRRRLLRIMRDTDRQRKRRGR